MFSNFVLVFLSVSVYVLFESTNCAMLAGGTGDLKEADAETQLLVNKVKPQLEQRANAQYGLFEAVSYKTQVVAGINTFVKVKVGDGQYVHLRIYTPLPYTNDESVLSNFQTNKSDCDELKYF